MLHTNLRVNVIVFWLPILLPNTFFPSFSCWFFFNSTWINGFYLLHLWHSNTCFANFFPYFPGTTHIKTVVPCWCCCCWGGDPTPAYRVRPPCSLYFRQYLTFRYLCFLLFSSIYLFIYLSVDISLFLLIILLEKNVGLIPVLNTCYPPSSLRIHII